jgi:predicted PilT family ATPase
MSVEVRELGDRKQEKEHEEPETKQEDVPYQLEIDKKTIKFNLDIKMQNKDIDVYVNDELLMTAKAGKTGLIKVKKNNNLGKVILDAHNKGEKIKLVV